MNPKSKHARKTPPKESAKPAPPKSMKRNAVLALIVLVAAGGTWAFCEFVLWNKLPADLVGKWVVKDGPQEGATFDFYRNGAMTGRVNLQGKEGIIKAEVRVEGSTLFSTTKHPVTGDPDTRKQTIRVLTAEELVLVDEKGMKWNMERADR